MRCDGDPGGCENCLRLNFECSLSRPGSIQGQTQREALASGRADGTGGNQRLLERRRAARACIQCRGKKTKCSGDIPSCQRCLHRLVQCQYPLSLKQSALSSGVAKPAASQSTPDTASSSERSTESNILNRSHYSLPSPASALRR